MPSSKEFFKLDFIEDIIMKLNNNHPTFKVWISRELSNQSAFKRLIEKANGTITAR